MDAPILTAGPDPLASARELRALVPDGDSVAAAVAEIVAAVADGGDAAVSRYTRLYDTRGSEPAAQRVSDADLSAARVALDEAVAAGLTLANTNVGRVAAASLHADRTVDFGTHSVTVRETPVARAAVYVPGGRAPYPSTVVMGVATARAAGVDQVVVGSPHGPGGDVQPAILAACAITGADEVYRMGGAQAIAALAFGTPTVAPVDVIVGPGHLNMQEA